MHFRLSRMVLPALAFLSLALPALADDGYDLWLRYQPIEQSHAGAYRLSAEELVVPERFAAARDELERGLSGLLGRPVPFATTVRRDGTVLAGTPETSPDIAALHLPLSRLGREGFVIRTVTVHGKKTTVIAANAGPGVLYGAFRYLRLLQTRQPVARLDIRDAPKIKLRVIDHWDNLDRTIERGYAGFSIWDWQTLPDYIDPHYIDYARAEASVGINGVVLNNVGAQAEILTPYYLEKVAALAKAFRPYNIKVYLSIRFSAPIAIGGLKTADPLDPDVREWWRAKANEIYAAIPDFGGFLVKANSEGQPGPQDYGRNHADGANMLADALAPHGGIVMWRAFVYSNNPKEDRIKQAYDEFVPLDGKFRPNVVIQVKNGPLDFQPREPFSPLFGAMPKTDLALELQITKEYLGFATHLVYLGPLFEEVLRADTYARGKGTTVARIIDDENSGHRLTAIAGVANVGTDRDWCGSIFNQANWYAFGRLAWNPDASARTIAEDWAAMTFTADPAFVGPTVDMMMKSREAAVDYMTPLGLAHLMGTGHHYGPAPWVNDAGRADWNPVYFHRADKNGIGVDRTKSGSDALAQYAPKAAARLQADENYLLWFHHLSWDHRMASGRTLWAELVYRYDRGVAETAAMRQDWARMKPFVDAERFDKTATFLAVQEKEAKWWRDACIAYFQSVSGRPLPAGVAPPAHPLSYYQALRFPYAPGIAR
jgi:alpha-glucuronidase